ncbi:hypothetical protein PVAG01_08213 [Phlyctema vagabunda]|uniref:RRM domain-containing protein n=1 Tax=Phlyctema vagabunda TaxID=108571 RepID=A0ABR4P8V3_9HELO
MSWNVRSDLLELADWDWSTRTHRPEPSTTASFKPVQVHDSLTKVDDETDDECFAGYRTSVADETVAAVTQSLRHLQLCGLPALDQRLFVLNGPFEPNIFREYSVIDQRPSQIENQRPVNAAFSKLQSPKRLSPALFNPPTSSPPPRPYLKARQPPWIDSYDLAVAQAKEFTLTFFPRYAMNEKMEAEKDPKIREVIDKHKEVAGWVDSLVMRPKQPAAGNSAEPADGNTPGPRRSSRAEEFSTGNQLGTLFASIQRSRGSTISKNPGGTEHDANMIRGDGGTKAADPVGLINTKSPNRTDSVSATASRPSDHSIEGFKTPRKGKGVDRSSWMTGSTGSGMEKFPNFDENIGAREQKYTHGSAGNTSRWGSGRERGISAIKSTEMSKLTAIGNPSPPTARNSWALDQVGNIARVGRSESQNKLFSQQVGNFIKYDNPNSTLETSQGSYQKSGGHGITGPPTSDAFGWSTLPTLDFKTAEPVYERKETGSVALSIAQAQEFTKIFFPKYAKSHEFNHAPPAHFQAIIGKYKKEKWAQPGRQVALGAEVNDLSKDMSPSNVCVAGLDGGLNKVKIRNRFSVFGYVDAVQFIYGNDGRWVNAVFVQFRKEVDAMRAMAEIQNSEKLDAWCSIKKASEVAGWTVEQIRDMK